MDHKMLISDVMLKFFLDLDNFTNLKHSLSDVAQFIVLLIELKEITLFLQVHNIIINGSEF